ncbi:hypothetical protein [Lysobacter gummosus]|uniref:hypothetical protein n=1 Tax=Lysobacter gummosus TaxID=262324 RepID=UPI00362FC679
MLRSNRNCRGHPKSKSGRQPSHPSPSLGLSRPEELRPTSPETASTLHRISLPDRAPSPPRTTCHAAV